MCDGDGDAICDDVDPCWGWDNYVTQSEEGYWYVESIDDDEDGVCNDVDACFGINDLNGDSFLDDFDGDAICDDVDPCFGWDNYVTQNEEGSWYVESNDEDEDAICDDVDPCYGFDNWVDEDGCITYNDTDEDGQCDDMQLSSDNVYIPETYSISNAYPNPFNPSTNFQYEIPDNAMVNIQIYDLNGRMIEQLVSSHHSPGVYNISWNASKFSSGIYILLMKSNDFLHSQKISLTK